jgi:hypothetical protein
MSRHNANRAEETPMPSLRARIILLSSVAIVGAVSAAAKPQEAADQEAVRETVEAYFTGIMEYDETALRQAFHEDAILQASLPTRHYRAPFNEWVRFAEGTPPADKSGYHNEILSIDIAGNAAVAKTDLRWPTVHYVDYLSLLKVGDEWKIVSKIWFQERR